MECEQAAATTFAPGRAHASEGCRSCLRSCLNAINRAVSPQPFVPRWLSQRQLLVRYSFRGRRVLVLGGSRSRPALRCIRLAKRPRRCLEVTGAYTTIFGVSLRASASFLETSSSFGAKAVKLGGGSAGMHDEQDEVGPRGHRFVLSYVSPVRPSIALILEQQKQSTFHGATFI